MLLLTSIHAEILNLKLHYLSTGQPEIKDKKSRSEDAKKRDWSVRRTWGNSSHFFNKTWQGNQTWWEAGKHVWLLRWKKWHKLVQSVRRCTSCDMELEASKPHFRSHRVCEVRWIGVTRLSQGHLQLFSRRSNGWQSTTVANILLDTSQSWRILRLHPGQDRISRKQTPAAGHGLALRGSMFCHVHSRRPSRPCPYPMSNLPTCKASPMKLDSLSMFRSCRYNAAYDGRHGWIWNNRHIATNIFWIKVRNIKCVLSHWDLVSSIR